jgi:flagellar basal-body rod protein FlgB
MDVNDKTLKALATAIKFREMRQKIISSNIANANTPGFKAKRLDFEKALARAINVDGNLSMKAQDPDHFDVGNGGFDNLEPDMYEEPSDIVSSDGNTVDIEAEISREAENAIMHEAMVKMLNKKLALKKYLIQSER